MRTGSWRINRDEAPLELWLWQAGRELIVALRITNNADRQHGGRPEERAVALRPSAAAAMVLLTRPEPDDVFLDPMCGSGTLLLERAQMGRYQLLLGGDSDPAAVETTLANFGPRHQPRRIERWDARHLPLEDGSVNKIACNLPWGRQVGEKGDMPALYRDFLAEAARVLSPVGRMALLTGEWSALKTALGARSELILDETVRDISILGRRADLFVITRR
jgi:23S rRNA G2445 N2-methylase RlmL